MAGGGGVLKPPSIRALVLSSFGFSHGVDQRERPQSARFRKKSSGKKMLAQISEIQLVH